MKQIKLTKNQIALVDDEDYNAISRHSWHAINVKSYPVAARKTKKETNGKRRVILMSREIMIPSPNMIVDHINHNTLDNRKCNLRVCTQSQNMQNRIKHESKTSKYKGVSWDKKSEKWRTTIKVNDKIRYLGLFNREDIAADLYDIYAKKFFGEFALINFNCERR